MKIDISPASFIGLGSHIEYGRLAFPFGPIDIFGMSIYKKFPFYPWSSNGLIWLILIHKSVLDSAGEEIKIEIKTKDNDSIGYFSLSAPEDTDRS